MKFDEPEMNGMNWWPFVMTETAPELAGRQAYDAVNVLALF